MIVLPRRVRAVLLHLIDTIIEALLAGGLDERGAARGYRSLLS